MLSVCVLTSRPLSLRLANPRFASPSRLHPFSLRLAGFAPPPHRRCYPQVSNFNVEELTEFVTAGVPLPSVNQLHHNLYGRMAADVAAFCRANNIHLQSYSPLGVPDHVTFKPPCAPVLLEDPVLLTIAAAHGMSPAQVVLAHQWAEGISSNPCTMDALHMIEVINAAGMADLLTADEIAQLDARPQC